MPSSNEKPQEQRLTGTGRVEASKEEGNGKRNCERGKRNCTCEDCSNLSTTEPLR
jgi:hypothetical protein